MIRYRKDTRPLVNRCLNLDVGLLYQQGLLRRDGLPLFAVLSWGNGDEQGRSSFGVDVSGNHVTLHYSCRDDHGEQQDVLEPVLITWTPCNYGGRRPWFCCPGVSNGGLCDRRVAKLYMCGRYFHCRHCYGLVYPSQNVAVSTGPSLGPRG